MDTHSLTLKSIHLLSRLLISPGTPGDPSPLDADVLSLTRPEFDTMVALAETNHVLVRGIGVFRDIAERCGDGTRRDWAEESLSAEKRRIRTALSSLARICEAFRQNGLKVAVIKSLDHLPDLGSDLDLYTDARPDEVIQLMQTRFDAQIASRSWGDRLASKWNFAVPGLPEFVEIHIGRLGQTGEQSAIAVSLLHRTRTISVDGQRFEVSSVSDRLLISTLQRMYRHFYFRLCDIVDSAGLVETGFIDWQDLYRSATRAGIWEGVATYLAIVSDYLERYRGTPLEIPPMVSESARFGGKEIYFAKDFLRVPILPHSAKLYGSQLATGIRRRQVQSSARLSLLPWLATAALVGQKITGSDKGVW
jgi:hypothetical protein